MAAGFGRAGAARRRLWGGRGPFHKCHIQHPDVRHGWIGLEELSDDQKVCGARADTGERAFGTVADVVGAVARRPTDDPWVAAVQDALVRELTWTGLARRATLEVHLGAGEMFHVSAEENRDSIERHGLDWRRMGSAPRVAGSRTPELEAVFLCADEFDTSFFERMARTPTDTWAADVTGLWVESGPSGWAIVVQPVPAERVRLLYGERTQSPRAAP